MAAGNADAALVQMILAAGVIGGRYTNLVHLDTGTGGAFSLAFGADDSLTNQKVFLKFLHPKHNGDYRGQSFNREIEIYGRLVGKENIVQMKGGPGELELQLTHAASGLSVPLPCHFFALERAHQDFASYLLKHGRPPALHRRIAIVYDVAKGVNRLHLAGYCHRDLKPDNILLFRGGTAKLGDLGTCRSLSPVDQHLEQYAGPVGALGYAAPEMLCGGWNTHDLYKGADWFAVGAVLFEAVTGVNLYVAVGMRYEDLVDMVEHFGRIPEEGRLQRFEAVVGDIAGEYPIPSVREFISADVLLGRSSDATLNSLDRFVRSSCHFDHNRRIDEFSMVLRSLEICRMHALFDERERAKQLMRGRRTP